EKQFPLTNWRCCPCPPRELSYFELQWQITSASCNLAVAFSTSHSPRDSGSSMTNLADTSPDVPRLHSVQRRLRGGLVLIMGCVAIVAPFVAGSLGLFLTGILLIVCGVLEMLETFRSGDSSSTRWNYLSGEMSILAGILLLNKPELMLRAVALFLAIIFVLDGIGKGIACWRARRAGSAWIGFLVIGVVKVAPAVMLVL